MRYSAVKGEGNMDKIERQRCYKVLEKLTPEELNDAKTIIEKSIEIGVY